MICLSVKSERSHSVDKSVQKPPGNGPERFSVFFICRKSAHTDLLMSLDVSFGERLWLTPRTCTWANVLGVHSTSRSLFRHSHDGKVPQGLEPQLHIFYGERVMDVADDLPKFKDLPEPFGGTGELLA